MRRGGGVEVEFGVVAGRHGDGGVVGFFGDGEVEVGFEVGFAGGGTGGSGGTEHEVEVEVSGVRNVSSWG